MTSRLTLRDYLESLGWTVPPECGGQIVEVSYHGGHALAYHRIYDRSDRTTSYYLAEWPENEEGDGWEFSPQNGEPRGLDWRRIPEAALGTTASEDDWDDGRAQRLIGELDRA